MNRDDAFNHVLDSLLPLSRVGSGGGSGNVSRRRQVVGGAVFAGGVFHGVVVAVCHVCRGFGLDVLEGAVGGGRSWGLLALDGAIVVHLRRWVEQAAGAGEHSSTGQPGKRARVKKSEWWSSGCAESFCAGGDRDSAKQHASLGSVCRG